MNSRQKRSNGGYGLRRKVAKKRLDEDFEYYFSKIGASFETPASKPGKEQRDTHLVMVTGLVDPTGKSEIKIECADKRPRGRPKKHDFVDTALKLVEYKEKKTKKYRADYLEESETTKAVGEICMKGETVMTVACEEEVENVDCIAKRIKLENILAGDEMTGLQEEEVSSLPEGEKENLPEEGIHLETESDPEEVLGVQMDINVHGHIVDEAVVYDVEHDGVDKDSTLLKMKRKYKKGRLTQDAIQKLSQLSPDDKIECNECHKLLKPSSFRQHLRTHTGEKPFGCKVCDARFTRKGDVERHVRIVHNKQKPFKCCRCQRAFGDKKNLRWHLMNHDKKLFYVCEVCGFKFGKREYWENHVRFIHPIPGGLDLDDNNIDKLGDEDEGEDRLRTLTKTLLGSDESLVDDPIQDCSVSAAVKSIQNREHSMEDTISAEVTLPFVNQVQKQEGIKIINVKNLNLSGLVKLGRPKTTGNLHSYSRVVNQNPNRGIEAVVIQFDGSSTGGGAVHAVPQHQQLAPNLIHVVNTEDVLQIVESGETQDEQSIIIETQDLSNPSSSTVMDCTSDVIQEQVVEVQDTAISGRGDGDTVQYVDETDEPSKVISIMLTEDEGAGGDTNSSSVQTLIEALLVAAKGDNETSSAQTT